MLVLILTILIATRGVYCLVSKKKFFDSGTFNITSAVFSALIVMCLTTLMIPEYNKENNLKIITDAKNRIEQEEAEIDKIRVLMEKSIPEDKKYYSYDIQTKKDRINDEYEVIKSARKSIEKESSVRYLLYLEK